MKGRLLGLFSVIAACSSRGSTLDFNLEGGLPSDAGGAVDVGTATDRGTSPDTGTAPDDAGTTPDDAGTPPADVGPVTACTMDIECRAAGLVCDRVMNRCVECIADADCGSGRFCPPSHVCTLRVCMPGESTCLGTTRQSTCNSRGSAQTETACASGETCRSGRCQPSACSPGAATCDEATGQRRVCNAEGSGTTLVACGSGQRCSGGACVVQECTPNSRTCVGTTSIRICDSTGSSATTMACPPLPNATGGCALNTCGFVCMDGFADCNRTFSDGCETTLASSAAHCGACGRACPSGQSCRSGSCTTATSAPNFRVLTLGTTGCRALLHKSTSGDDRGGIAVSSDAVYYTGDTATVRAPADLLSLTSVGARHDGIFSDLATGEVYVLLTAAGTQPVDTAISATVTQLGRLSATGALTATRIPLSMPVTVSTNSSTGGVFAGMGQVVIHAGTVTAGTPGNWYAIDLPGGAVRLLGSFDFPTHSACETWAAWGIAESVGGDVSVLYVENRNTIARLRLADRTVTRAASFTATTDALSDVCSITFSPGRNRWYFHSEYATQLTTTTDEHVGYCDGSWTAVPP